jgi:hypothetical protein
VLVLVRELGPESNYPRIQRPPRLQRRLLNGP